MEGRWPVRSHTYHQLLHRNVSSFETRKAGRCAPAPVGASTLAESNASNDTLLLLLQSFQQLVGQLNWSDHRNVVTAEEACAFNEPSSLAVFLTDRPAVAAMQGSAATLGPNATLGRQQDCTPRRRTGQKGLLVGTLLQLVHRCTQALKLQRQLKHC